MREDGPMHPPRPMMRDRVRDRRFGEQMSRQAPRSMPSQEDGANAPRP
jgi:hypothetical protein